MGARGCSWSWDLAGVTDAEMGRLLLHRQREKADAIVYIDAKAVKICEIIGEALAVQRKRSKDGMRLSGKVKGPGDSCGSVGLSVPWYT